MKKTLFVMSVLTAALGITSAYAVSPASGAPATSTASAPAKSFTPAQIKEIQTILHDYLVDQPEVLMEASQRLQQRQQALMQAQAKSAIQKSGAALASGNLTVAGNPKGDVTLVEFFDYQCGHCVSMSPIIHELIKANSNLRVVFKEFPIFGKESEQAARGAIVAAMQGKYMKFQNKLFKVGKRIDEATITEVAKKVGLNMATFKTDMESQAVTDVLDSNHKLAEAIHLMGTPAFIILSTHQGHYQADSGPDPIFIPGEASQKTLQDGINRLGKKG
jgi:protein-disulfide isomerase